MDPENELVFSLDGWDEWLQECDATLSFFHHDAEHFDLFFEVKNQFFFGRSISLNFIKQNKFIFVINFTTEIF